MGAGSGSGEAAGAIVTGRSDLSVNAGPASQPGLTRGQGSGYGKSRFVVLPQPRSDCVGELMKHQSGKETVRPTIAAWDLSARCSSMPACFAARH